MTDVHQRTPNAPAYDIAAKILLIGEAGVGKTHLILRYGKLSNFVFDKKLWFLLKNFS